MVLTASDERSRTSSGRMSGAVGQLAPVPVMESSLRVTGLFEDRPQCEVVAVAGVETDSRHRSTPERAGQVVQPAGHCLGEPTGGGQLQRCGVEVAQPGPGSEGAEPRPEGGQRPGTGDRGLQPGELRRRGGPGGQPAPRKSSRRRGGVVHGVRRVLLQE